MVLPEVVTFYIKIEEDTSERKTFQLCLPQVQGPAY